MLSALKIHSEVKLRGQKWPCRAVFTQYYAFLKNIEKRCILHGFVDQYSCTALIFNFKMRYDSSDQGLQWDSADSTQIPFNKNEAMNCYEKNNQTKAIFPSALAF